MTDEQRRRYLKRRERRLIKAMRRDVKIFHEIIAVRKAKRQRGAQERHQAMDKKTIGNWIGVVGFGLVAIYYLSNGDMPNAGTAGIAALALLGVKMLPGDQPK